jgi:ABC-type sugar transport system substrate-binding protein
MQNTRRNRRPKLWVPLLLLLIVSALTLAACGSDDDDGDTTGAGNSAESRSGSLEGKSVYVLGCDDSNAFCAAYNETATRMGEEAGMDVTVLTSNFDPAEQARLMNQAIAANPDVILEVPDDGNAIVASLKKADAAGVPVINGIHRIAEEGYDAIAHSVEAETDVMGAAAAENIVDGLKEEGLDKANVIAITGAAAQFTAEDRMKAFEKVLGENPGYELVAVEDGEWADQKSQELASQLFAQYAPKGGIQAAYGMADNQANAIIQAAKQADIPVGVEKDGLIVSGSSCQPVTIENMKAGLQYGSATNSPIGEAEANMTAVIEFLEGEELPKVIPAKEERITLENLDKFSRLCNF